MLNKLLYSTFMLDLQPWNLSTFWLREIQKRIEVGKRIAPFPYSQLPKPKILLASSFAPKFFLTLYEFQVDHQLLVRRHYEGQCNHISHWRGERISKSIKQIKESKRKERSKNFCHIQTPFAVFLLFILCLLLLHLNRISLVSPCCPLWGVECGNMKGIKTLCFM